MLAVLTCGFLASCTATSGPGLELAAPAYNGGDVVSMMAEVAQAEAAGTTTTADAASDAAKPADPTSASEVKPAIQGQASAMQTGADSDQASNDETSARADGEVKVAAVEPAAKAEQDTAQASASEATTETASDETRQLAAAEEPKKKGFLAYFFSPQPVKAAPSPIVKQTPPPAADEKSAAAQENTPLVNPREKAKPLIQLASVDPEEASVKKAAIVPMDALPGVRQGSLFEISRKDGIDDDSDIDLNEAEGGIYNVASAAGLARLAPNGLLKARESVDTACLKPALVRILKTVEARFGKKFIITSGYRSRDHNRRVRGARNSMHMYCAAADVVMPGVSKWEIAQFVRSMRGRGGVGTYCHTDAVHIDVGPERDWNWRCRRRK